MGPVAHLGDGFLGGAKQLHNGCFRHLREITEQPGNRIWPVIPLGNGRIAPALGFGFRQMADRAHQLQPRFAIGFTTLDFFACQLTVGDRVIADDPLRHFAIGDGLDFKRVHADKFGDLVKSKRGLVNQPHGGGLGHQGLVHGITSRGGRARATPALLRFL